MVYPARFLALGVLYQCAHRARGTVTDGLESPRELCSRSTPSIRLGWGPVGRARIGWNRLRPHRFESGCRPRGCNLLDRAFVLGDALIVADAPSQSVPLPQFQWRESADPLSLLRLERHAVLLPTGFDTGARVHSDPGRRRASAVHPVDVSVVALVGWTSRSIWRKSSIGDRPFDRRGRIYAIHPARHRRVLLDDVLPGTRCAWAWHGNQRGAADHDGGELGRSKPCGDRVGSE